MRQTQIPYSPDYVWKTLRPPSGHYPASHRSVHRVRFDPAQIKDREKSLAAVGGTELKTEQALNAVVQPR